MALIDHVWNDNGFADQFDDATDTLGAQATNGGSGTGVFYVGTSDVAKKLQAASNPGIDSIVVSIVDASPGGGVETTHVKLAVSEAALSSATGGASLALGTDLTGGTAYPVWYQWDNSVGAGTYTEISLEIVPRVEAAI